MATKKKKGGMGMTALVVLLVFLLIGGGVWMFVNMGGNGDGDDDDDDGGLFGGIFGNGGFIEWLLPGDDETGAFGNIKNAVADLWDRWFG